ncbi:hypothetical protein E4U42_002516 [Claviceps africana]|uniref:Uncharacterized protein n=1 Tax=Claviceps africana TaxID=83212 RepID=A0A8K0NJN7_9HYPO|nr:hypothetical protein E4U42_002516 [Claviceps africana]
MARRDASMAAAAAATAASAAAAAASHDRQAPYAGLGHFGFGSVWLWFVWQGRRLPNSRTY